MGILESANSSLENTSDKEGFIKEKLPSKSAPNSCENEGDKDIVERSLKHTRQSDPILRTIVAVMTVLVAWAISMFVGHLLRLRTSLPEQLCSYEESSLCPSEEFLVNPEVHEVATATLMQLDHGLLKTSDWGMVKAIVVESFQKIRVGLQREAPEVVAMLRSVQITGMQKEALLDLLRLISNSNLQSIGFEIAQAIRENAEVDSVHMKGLIEQKLLARRDEIWALREQLCSAALLEFWGEGNDWSMTLSPENVKLMETVNGEWMDVIGEKHMRPQNGQTKGNMEETDGILGGVLEESRILLDMIELHVNSLGLDLSMPRLAMTLRNDLNLGIERVYAEDFSCDISKGASPLFLQTTLCLLRFGIQGVDALRAASDLMNIITVRNEVNTPDRHEVGIFGKNEMKCTYAHMGECPALDLLVDPQIHEVSTDILMRTGSGLFLPADRKMVRSIVAEGFQNISYFFQIHHPNMVAMLNSIQLSKLHKSAVLNVMQLMDDPQLQRIGFEVAVAIREATRKTMYMEVSASSEYIMYHIEQHLSPRRKEIWKLRNKLLHTSLHEFLGDGDQWNMTLHPDNIRAMETIDDRWIDVIGGNHKDFQNQLRMAATAMAPLTDLINAHRKNFGIFNGVIEEGWLLLNIIKIHARSVNNLLKVPQLTMDANTNSIVEHISCDLTGRKPMIWLLKAVLCPLKFGIHGIEALRAASDIMKVTSPKNHTMKPTAVI